MEHFISRWEIPQEMQLRITVSSKPLNMAKTFTWMYHTTNHYGQGAKRSWWITPEGNAAPEIDVEGDAADLLTSLVYAHEPLKHLVKYFMIPEVK